MLRTFDTAVEEVLRALPARGKFSLRLTVSGGPGPRGLDPPAASAPTMLLQVAPYQRDAMAFKRAVILDTPRIDPLDPLTGHKTVAALRWAVARRRARAMRADVALVRTIQGDVAEADFANLFAVFGETVVTPQLSRGVLPGITRAWALQTLRSQGRLAGERSLEPDELPGASEIFLTSSLVGVSPLTHLDGQALSGATPVADQLGKAFGRLAT